MVVYSSTPIHVSIAWISKAAYKRNNNIAAPMPPRHPTLQTIGETHMRRIALPITMMLGLFIVATPAHAQATRTWVSGVGDDANPCSRTAPCKTFAGAISKTAVNGEINCLDPGGFGNVTIAKSITIDCEDTQGSILVPAASTGVVINITSATDTLKQVRLRGLSINGAATATRGINFIAGNSLHLDEMFIQGMTGEGVLMNSAGGDLTIRDSNITGNQGAGIRTLSTTAGQAGIIHVSITRTTANRNQQGVRFEGNSFGVVSNSSASNNTLNGFVVFPASVGGAEMNIVDSDANNNKQFGVFAGGTGQSGVVRIFNLPAFHNTSNQLSINAGGSILSNGRNHIGAPTNAPGGFTDQ